MGCRKPSSGAGKNRCGRVGHRLLAARRAGHAQLADAVLEINPEAEPVQLVDAALAKDGRRNLGTQLVGGGEEVIDPKAEIPFSFQRSRSAP